MGQQRVGGPGGQPGQGQQGGGHHHHPQQMRGQQQQQHGGPGHPLSRQIPVIYEGGSPYVRNQQQQQHPGNCQQRAEGSSGHSMSSSPAAHPGGDHGYSRPSSATHQQDPFFDGQSRSQRLRRSQLPEDPFSGFGRSSFFNDPLFGVKEEGGR